MLCYGVELFIILWCTYLTGAATNEIISSSSYEQFYVSSGNTLRFTCELEGEIFVEDVTFCFIKYQFYSLFILILVFMQVV